MLSATIKRTIATALSGAAIAGIIGAPAASAMPIDPMGVQGEPRNTQVVPEALRSSPPAAVETAPGGGFDLFSAAIGAAAGAGLLIVVVVVVGGPASRRPITRGHHTAGA